MLPTTPAALAFANTLRPRAAALQRPQAEQVLQHLAALTPLLTPWDLQALGLWPDASAHCGTLSVRAEGGSGLPDGKLTVHESPAGQHRAMLWAAGHGLPCLAWVDGQCLDIPRQPDGQPQTLMPGHWAGEDFLCLETVVDGNQHGLWVCQVGSGRHWQLQPALGEHWPSPWARWVAGVGLQVWADSTVGDAAPARKCAL